MQINEYDGEGYHRLVEDPAWTMAMINYASRFDAANFTRMERHLKTDEVFVLLSGQATLVVGDPSVRIEMETSKTYNVKAGEWHHILVAPGTKVLVVENTDTGSSNTEYRSVD